MKRRRKRKRIITIKKYSYDLQKCLSIILSLESSNSNKRITHTT